MLQTFRRLFFQFVPRRFRLPLRYRYYRLTGNIEDELLILKDLIGHRQKGIAIDIGANTGIWSYPLSKICARVESFEPFLYSTKELKGYAAKNITIHNVALSSAKGERELHLPIIGGRLATALATFGSVKGEYQSSLVPVHILDDYNYKDVAFIKIDVEGHELDVLKGADATIVREKPLMVIEIEQRHLTFPMSLVFDKVFSFGYEGFFFYRGEFRPYSEFSYKVYQEPFLDNVLAEDYVNNFIFKPLSINKKTVF